MANEVKELAKDTAKATDQIDSRIGDIQSDTDLAVDAIKSICGIIDRISNIQSTIVVSVEEQSKVTQEISQSISQTANGNPDADQGATICVEYDRSRSKKGGVAFLQVFGMVFWLSFSSLASLGSPNRFEQFLNGLFAGIFLARAIR